MFTHYIHEVYCNYTYFEPDPELSCSRVIC